MSTASRTRSVPHGYSTAGPGLTFDMTQILGFTGDNASSNDTLVSSLEDLVNNFAGPVSQVRCFAHVINLVAKTVLRQFEVGKAGTEAETSDAEAAAILADLAAFVDIDGLEDDDEGAAGVEGEWENLDDDMDGWIDERKDLSEAERAELRECVLPVKLALAKVCGATHLLSIL